MLAFRCEFDLALTYSMRRPRLAIRCAVAALRAAIGLKRPDLAYSANELLASLGVAS